MTARAQKLRILTALETVAADPGRLAQALADAVTDEDAVRRVGTAFALDAELASVVLDQQIRALGPGARARRADELRVLAANWGPPLAVTARVVADAGLVVAIGGTEHDIRAAGSDQLLMRLHDFLVDHLARPQLRPVIASVEGLPEGPVRWTAEPDGSGSAEYDDERVAPDDEG
jgi:hypothetical protein